MGYDRSGVNSFCDYFRQLTEWEPKRAANHGIQHYAWMGINAKEAENVAFAKEVIAVLPEFLDRPNVLGIGEVGLHKNTKNEVVTLLELIELGVKRNEQMLFHTPHLADKYRGHPRRRQPQGLACLMMATAGWAKSLTSSSAPLASK